MSDKLQFVHENAARIQTEMVEAYESMTNRQLPLSDPIRLLINAYAYRELMVRVGINETGRQNLVTFSTGMALDYLAELVGVVRLPAQAALTTIRFTIIAGHTGVTIPAGIRVQSTDGKAIFRTLQEKTVVAGVYTADVEAVAMEAGVNGNFYQPGKIDIILDPQAYLVSAENITTTAGGSDDETDEQLRERIKLAPNSFSVAGPRDAYKFFAKSVNPGIVDVAVTNPTPGNIILYPLMSGGELPNADILARVLEVCNGERVRPLSDTVQAIAPTKVDYDIEIDVELLTGAVNATVQQELLAVLTNYANERKEVLGLDVVRSRIVSLCMLPNVYSCEVVSPAADIVIAKNEFTNCTGIVINITGTSEK